MNLFYGVAQATLVQMLSDARDELGGGKTLTQFGAGDTSGTFMLAKNLSPQARIEQIWFELNRLDPVTYPADAMYRVRVTSARFNDIGGNGTG